MDSEIQKLREENRYVEAYRLAWSRYDVDADEESRKDLFWVCGDMMKQKAEYRNGTDDAIMLAMHTVFAELSSKDEIIKQAYGWALYRYLCDNMQKMSSVAARKVLSEYLRIGAERPSMLHSAFLAVASKMAQRYADFHFVAFLRIWDVRNLRPEDRESTIMDNGRVVPSLIERLAKAYVYNLLFFPDEKLHDDSIVPELTDIINKKGYHPIVQMVATKIYPTEVRGRKVHFVKLVGTDGQEASCEIRKLIAYNQMRYAQVVGQMFDVVLRTSDEGKVRVEVAKISAKSIRDCFEMCVGYVDFIDLRQGHIHIFDQYSRHLVANIDNAAVRVGDYVNIAAIIPQHDKFKSAYICDIYTNDVGPEAFGFRRVKVTYVDNEKGYVAWEIIEGKPVEELISNGQEDAQASRPSYVKGFISQQIFQQSGNQLPAVGAELEIITFLKRGKDGKKRPKVVMCR